MNNIRSFLQDNIKNVSGWRTSRKLIVIVVDDYGNIRLGSKKARENMDKAGLKVYSRFDAYDTLETREDLEALYEVLQSVKDKTGRPAVFTPYSLSCNPDFIAMRMEGNNQYILELLPATYDKLSAEYPDTYEGTWALWQEGILKNLMAPQYHGREHLNLKIFNGLLSQKDPILLECLKNRSVAGLNDAGYPHMGWTAAFSFQSEHDIEELGQILEDGISTFTEVYGYRPTCFTPPARQFPLTLEDRLPKLGLHCLDRPFYDNRHLGSSKYMRQLSVMKKIQPEFCHQVRNVVFEPTASSIDHVAIAIRQIETAFRWRKPAIISSHRVNFCGLISEKNRKKGLEDLRELLKQIVARWPDVEFISAAELSDLIINH